MIVADHPGHLVPLDPYPPDFQRSYMTALEKDDVPSVVEDDVPSVVEG
jgi:hypothetical protein